MVAPTAGTSPGLSVPALVRAWQPRQWAAVALTATAFVVLFAGPARSLAHDWWTVDDAGHGLLLFPLSLWLAWQRGLVSNPSPSRAAGIALLIVAIVLRALGGLAAELSSQRFSIWLAAVALIVYQFGWRQVRQWWLPLTVMVLAIPLPALILNKLAIPLQFRASRIGKALMDWRHMNSVLSGNVITLYNDYRIPIQRLFVAEACSGLRSLSALLALGVLLGGMYLRTIPMRLVLLALSVPLAVLLNGIRIFLSAFLAYYVDPELASGVSHESQGWVIFVVAFVMLAIVAFGFRFLENQVIGWRTRRA